MIDQAILLISSNPPDSSARGANRTKNLLGLTLPERTILAAASAGVRSFYVLYQSRKDPLPLFRIRAAALKKAGVRLESAFLDELPENTPPPPDCRGTFLLIEANSVLDPEIFKQASSLNIDHNVKAVLKTEESICPGIFLMSGTLRPALIRMLKEKRTVRLGQEMMKELAPEAPWQQFEIKGKFCIRIESRHDLKDAERRLLQTGRRPTDGVISRHLNRPISLFVSRGLLKLNIRPLPVTFANLIIGLASAWFTAQGGYAYMALGGLLFQAASVFDGCDGEISRLMYRTSRLGAFLDTTFDALIFVAYFSCLPLGLYAASRKPVYLIMGALVLACLIFFYAMMIRFIKKSGLSGHIVKIANDIKNYAHQKQYPIGRIDRAASKVVNIYRRDVFAFAAFLSAVFNGTSVAFSLIVLLCFLESFYFFFYSRRELSRKSGLQNRA